MYLKPTHQLDCPKKTCILILTEPNTGSNYPANMFISFQNISLTWTSDFVLAAIHRLDCPEKSLLLL